VTASLTAIPKEHFQGASSSCKTTGAGVKVQKSNSLNMTGLCVIYISLLLQAMFQSWKLCNHSTYLNDTRAIKLLCFKIRHNLYL